MIEQSEVIPLLLAACPSFQATWDEHRAWWDYEEAGRYNDLAEFARHLVALAREQETACFPAVFAIIERLIAEGDDQMYNLVVVGLFEGVQNVSSNTGLDPEVFLPWLGPRARKAWDALIAYWDDLLVAIHRKRISSP